MGDWISRCPSIGTAPRVFEEPGLPLPMEVFGKGEIATLGMKVGRNSVSKVSSYTSDSQRPRTPHLKCFLSLQSLAGSMITASTNPMCSRCDLPAQNSISQRSGPRKWVHPLAKIARTSSLCCMCKQVFRRSFCSAEVRQMIIICTS